MFGETLAECQPAEMSLAKAENSIRENLETKKQRLEKQLANTTAAIEAMDTNPEVARVMELVLKAGRY